MYNTHFYVERKSDNSPVTLADKNADKIIRKILEESDFYIMSEEEPILPYHERKSMKCLWIVDPVDGTKEFVKKNGEFTTNIALIENGIPIIGVVGIPTQKKIYFGSLTTGSGIISTSENALPETFIQLPYIKNDATLRLIGSRSHMNVSTLKFIEQLTEIHKDVEVLTYGSSIKLCKVAEGYADVYPRFSPISEWDVAAGHAVIKYAGGKVINPMNGNEITYNKEDLDQYPFIALRKGMTLPY